ncbi:baseplate hub protein [Dickeya poaceiphila]|uniref:Uncharacterized protein n=1 Tax=Dickeya poaceiphila TaxID=568768 RepID=A0A5B8I340_9GAMM|nr:hypothetical protein [Dickeya poaceiphila]QDX29562.1 hypothetical protein Dpoa569_0001347 [Dickeya poaceiphila]
MTYERRDIEIKFKLSEGSFDDKKENDTITLKGFKCEVSVSAYGGATGTVANARIYGLSMDIIAKLTSRTRRIIAQKQNQIEIIANDERIFSGSITSPMINANMMPEAPIEIIAQATAYERTIPFPATSVAGKTTAQDLIKGIAGAAGFSFYNADVDVAVDNQRFDGSAIDQIQSIARAYGFNADIDVGKVTIYTGKNPIDDKVVLISADHGMIGYPIFTELGISVTCLYSPLIKVCRKIRIESDLPHVSGDYLIQVGTSHYLSSQIEGGPWFSVITATPTEWVQ